MLVLSRFDSCFNGGVVSAKRSSKRLDRANLRALHLSSQPTTYQRAVKAVRLAPGSQAKARLCHGSSDQRLECRRLCHTPNQTIRSKIIQDQLAPSDKMGQDERITPQPANFDETLTGANRNPKRKQLCL